MLENIINEIDSLSPTYLDISNPKYIEKDDKYISTLLVVDYSKKFHDLILKNIINEDTNMQIAIKFQKKDKYKIIKELTYHIGNSGAFLKDSGDNVNDAEIVILSNSDARYIRKRLQVDNDEIYVISIYITLIQNTLEQLLNAQEKLLGVCISNGIIVRKANFRQLQGYEATLPISEKPNIVEEITKRNVLCSGLVSTYPFLLSSINDKQGILIGKTIDSFSLVMVDKFNRENYKNGNMTIFGTSGSGKSYFTKLNILREYLKGVKQYVIDPEREYIQIAKYLDGSIIKIGPSSKEYINIFDITKDSVEKGYLSNKLIKLKSFFKLIFENISSEDYSQIEDLIIETYGDYNITFDDSSLYESNLNNDKSNIIAIDKTFKKKENMPLLEDLYFKISKNEKLYKYSKMLKPFVKGSLSFFNNRTNVNLDNDFIVADIFDLGEENYKYGMSLFIELFWDKIKKNREKKKIIYIDEIWRIIGATSNEDTAKFIYIIFKTIRKYNGCAVAITQDINDLFSLNNGMFGKSIISNSSFKALFSLDEDNINVLSENISLTENEKIKINNLSKGECIYIAENNKLLLKAISNSSEQKIIEEIK